MTRASGIGAGLQRFLSLTVLLVVPGCGRGREPNVILISVDTLRADRLNCYGYRTRSVSPTIDALAKEGVLFESHVAAAPWTTPSHMSLLTSLYPTAHGVTASFDALKRSLRSSGEFQRLAATKKTLPEVLASRGFSTGAFTGGLTLDPRIGFGRGFSLYDTSMFKLRDQNMGAMYSWIRAHRTGPFFVFFHTFEVHAPYLDTTYLSDVLPKETAAGVEAALRQLPPDWKARDEEPRVLKDLGAFDRETSEALYLGGIRSVDRWVGGLVSFLKEERLYDGTLIVLTSDHGEQFGERPPDPELAGDSGFYDSHGHTLFEELVHIPLILKLPGGSRGGTRVRAVSSAVDVMPTILDLVGLRGEAGLEGTSLRPDWEQSPPLRPAYFESLRGRAEAKGLRAGRYKYVVGVDEESVKAHGRSFIPPQPSFRSLFDLARDPEEKENLLGDRAEAKARTLADAFDQALRREAARAGKAEAVSLDEETLGRLRALGYVHE